MMLKFLKPTAKNQFQRRTPTYIYYFRPNALAYQDLDAYAAAWRDALVKELCAYKATSDHCFSVVLQRRFDEARFSQAEWRSGRQDASQGTRAPRVAAQCRAHGAQMGAVALRRPHGAPLFLSLNLD
jgi:hypothetical protein